MLSGTKSASGGERNFEHLNWGNPAEVRGSSLIEKSSIRERNLIQKRSDEAQTNLLRAEIANFVEQNALEYQSKDIGSEESDHIFAVREQKIDDAKNVFGEDSFFAHLMRN